MFSDGKGRFRRECGLSDFRGRILVVRWIDLRRDEKIEDPHIPLFHLGQWLSDELNASRLAEMCRHTDAAWSAGGITREELRDKLEQAFQSRALVAVRLAAEHGVIPSPDSSQAGGVSPEVPGEGPKRLRLGWRIVGISGADHVAKKSDVPPAMPTEEPNVAIRHLDRWLADGSGRAALVEMYKSVYGPDDLGWAGVFELKAKLASAFTKRELLMLREIDTGAGDPSGDGEGGEGRDEQKDTGRKSQPPPDTKPVKTWIAFQLVDEDGQPVPGELYKIRITDGSVREGRLGAEGQVRIPNIDPGTCIISFPELDASEWHPL